MIEPNKKAKANRIGILDSYRAIAILAVVLFHFFSLWTPPHRFPSLYPYNNKYDYFSLGYLGVHFFFMISGFVIFFTLDKTENILLFWKKRLIRLVPSMVIACIIIILFFNLFDHDNLFPASHKIRNILPSVTFLNPDLFNQLPVIFKGHYDYLNGSFWSLWPEIQFYIFSSMIYFFNKRKFLQNFLAISTVIILLHYLLLNSMGSNKLHLPVSSIFSLWYTKWFGDIFDLTTFLPFFALGVIFYSFYKKRSYKTMDGRFVIGIFCFLIIKIIYSGIYWDIRILYILMILSFLAFIYFPDKLKIFENKLLMRIGLASYFLYLIHENIGVFLINSVGKYFFGFASIFTLILIISLIWISIIYTEHFDRKLNAYFKRKL